MGDSRGGFAMLSGSPRTLAERPLLSLRSFQYRIGTDTRFQTLLVVASRPGLVGKRASLTSKRNWIRTGGSVTLGTSVGIT